MLSVRLRQGTDSRTMMSPPQRSPSSSVKDSESCVSCGLKLCSAPSPQLLPCLHSLCRDCFTLPDKITGPECPVCQEKYKLQDVVSNLVCGESSSVPKEGIKCGGCEDSSVTGWCEGLCAVCVAAHKRVKVACQHNVHAISPDFPHPVVCPIHKKTQVNTYCLTCDQLTCRHCPPFHHSHMLQDIPGAVRHQRTQVRRMVRKVHYKKLAAQKCLSDLGDRLSDLEELEMNVRLQVTKTVVSLCKVIVKKAAKLLKEMEDLCEKEREKLVDQKAKIQHLQKKQEHVLAFADKALGSQDRTVLLSCKRQIHHQLQHLLEQNVFSIPTVMELKFQCNLATVKKALKAFGCIVACEVPSASYQNPSPSKNTTDSLPHSVSLPQSHRPHHFPEATPPSPKTSNPPIRARLRLASSGQYSKYPKMKRPWSYHPYHPSDSTQPSQATDKSLMPKKVSLPSSSTAASQLIPHAASFLCASAPAQPTPSATPLAVASDPTQTSYGKNTNSPSVGSHQNNSCLDGDLLKQTGDLSPAEPSFSPLRVLQTTADSTCLSVPPNGSVRSGEEMEPTLTVPDAPIRDLLISEGTSPVLIQATQDRGLMVGHTVRELEFTTSPDCHCFPPESSSAKVLLNSSADAPNSNRLEEQYSSVSAGFPQFCIKSSPSTAPSQPNIILSGSDIKRFEANSCILAAQSPSTAVCQPQHTSQHENAVVSLHPGINVLQESEESLEDSLKTTCVTSTLTKDNIHSLSADHVKLPKTGVPVKEEKVNTDVGLAVPDLVDSYCFPVEEEDEENVTALLKIRNNEGNLVVLEPLGRDWLPDVTVCRLSIPDYALCSPAPVLRVLPREGSNDFQLGVIQEAEQSPALHPTLIAGCPDISCLLLANRLNCAACKLPGILVQCCMCRRSFHRECHIPPVTSLIDAKQWQCLLCRDPSNTENLELYPECNGLPNLSMPDQRKCEYLLLTLTCNKQSSTLYRSVKMSSLTDHYIDVTLVRGRLLRKLTPPYRTPAEFVSDVWLLLSTLLQSSQEAQHVKGLQRLFSKALRRVFGQSLHPSLLKDPFRRERERIATEGNA
ncbi:transcription intermediary factor 1-beta-like isoform X1 [Electrophorus electricus]|uniref:transcription intermediary factor 1-beta-like isoform X1 n=2 Tax=Electrophorus electricus TaxID=8005 RepID=UPI0015CFBFC6|nr:transcription intermediary factor 1-beta-like isoform X1 [Electrophorus electricus]XP_026886380.2 transcription intermediary factor 1-beta-like isoform X1 [Electrophorus electricus]XP_026886381.2 transcription intermediary factor 1-beta-like isoform X1 [Electrophorus electricus]XP_026886382.2 transcription intermediary factor 1-beta-like isoform X1 [Electrophorus electricus]XP_026886383.2 transcription intermediary factor 1-beta-like isoform X1 [Electrophorus electricus]XP_035385175.1 trans